MRHLGTPSRPADLLPTPFSEFLWADFLRRRISRKRVVSAFEAAVVKALDLARGQEASYLPGWCGPIEN